MTRRAKPVPSTGANRPLTASECRQEEIQGRVLAERRKLEEKLRAAREPVPDPFEDTCWGD
ncbi:hypothetical protein [Nocardiopsis sp. FIRDI 009]|uniref:hypothetical protein n=1 Tax=Nocardiopsis sp. FIRDI 009 TaxID=714197 RepID=UPI000E22714E|nr:hypothetical protein [Nocardiopsis sp. FIRDI 009]